MDATSSHSTIQNYFSCNYACDKSNTVIELICIFIWYISACPNTCHNYLYRVSDKVLDTWKTLLFAIEYLLSCTKYNFKKMRNKSSTYFFSSHIKTIQTLVLLQLLAKLITLKLCMIFKNLQKTKVVLFFRRNPNYFDTTI